MENERYYQVDDPLQIVDWVTFCGIKIPRFLITQDTFNEKLVKSTEIIEEVRKERAKGTATEDAGDTHGQFHNEYEWYRQQSLELRARIGLTMGKYLDRAIIIKSYNEVRENLSKLGVDPTKSITFSSQVEILYQDEDQPEDILIVSLLDGGHKPNWVSIESPLGTALLGHSQNEEVEYKVIHNNEPPEKIKVKIISIS